MLEYILSHPLYIPFLIFNIFIIYKTIKFVLKEDKGSDDDDGGNFENDDPVLNLPPGVTLPDSDKKSVING